MEQAKTIEGSSATNKAGGWKGTGRRIIGEVAGHKINLEIEDVQDKINKNILLFWFC